MKTSLKFLAAGGAMVATIGLVGAVQAHGWGDRGGDGPRHERHFGGHGFRHGGFGPGMDGPGGHGPVGGMMMMRVFQMADTDGDRSVTQEDLDKLLQDRMKQYDANGDGELQLDEYKKLFAELVEPMAVRSFQFLDPNGDAAVTADELSKPLQGVVERMDRNGDGKLTMQDRGGFGHGGWGDRDGRGGRGERWHQFRGDDDRGPGPRNGMPAPKDDGPQMDVGPAAE